MSIGEKFDNKKQEAHLTDTEIFKKIWTSPRLVFKYLNDNRYDKYVTVLLVFAGITRTFDRASTKSMGDDMSLAAVIGFSIILGGLLGWITYYIYAAAMCWTGKWLGGIGDTKSLLRMIAHAMIPSIVALIFLIPQIVLFGNSLFQSEMDIYSNGIVATIIFFVTVLIEITLGIWTVVIFVIGISEVQQLSIGRSILNMLLPALIIVFPIMLIAFIVGSISG